MDNQGNVPYNRVKVFFMLRQNWRTHTWSRGRVLILLEVIKVESTSVCTCVESLGVLNLAIKSFGDKIWMDDSDWPFKTTLTQNRITVKSSPSTCHQKRKSVHVVKHHGQTEQAAAWCRIGLGLETLLRELATSTVDHEHQTKQLIGGVGNLWRE